MELIQGIRESRLLLVQKFWHENTGTKKPRPANRRPGFNDGKRLNRLLFKETFRHIQQSATTATGQ